MASETTKVSYFRTLVFTVIAAIMSLGLFGILFVEGGKDWMPFVIAVELGIFGIITYCITLIVQREKLLENQKDAKNYSLKFDMCPDYFIKRYDEITQKDFCSNEYSVIDLNSPFGKRVTMKIVGESDSLPTFHSSTYMNRDPNTKVASPPEPLDKFYTDALYDTSIKTDSERCSIIARNASPDSKFENKFKQLPWTYARTRCDGLYGKI